MINPRVSPTFLESKPAAGGMDMPDMDTGMSQIQMMSSVSVPVVSISMYPAGFTYPCQTLDTGGTVVWEALPGKIKHSQ